jgi:hypothetical protein
LLALRFRGQFFLIWIVYQKILRLKNKRVLFTCAILICLSFPAVCQKQLIILKGERVKLRLYPGDEISFKLKGSKRIWRTYINNLSDTSVVTHSDTIPFHHIERMYFAQPMFINRVGGALVFGGAALFLIDQANVVLVEGNDPNLDSWVSTFTITSMAAGLPMLLIKKKSQKMNYKYRLMTVKKGSPFYQPDPRRLQSPFMLEN